MDTDDMPGVMSRYQDFAAGVGRTWSLHLSDGPAVEVVLSACVPRSSPGLTGFTLTFLYRATADDHPLPEQGTYLLSRAGSEAAPVFLVPVARTAAGTELEAVFTELLADREAAS